MKKKIFKINDLKLWDENPRFPEGYFKKTETELIEYLFNKKGEKEKIIELAKSIIDNFEITPWERLLVLNFNKENIVLEGNRRLMIYKLLLDPSIITNSKVRRIFENGKKETKINTKFSVECLQTDSREEGLRYVELKHLEAGYKGWGTSERTNFKKRRGKKNDEITIISTIDKIVRSLDIPEELKEQVLGQGYVTTFYRVVTTAPAKKYFGYEVQNDKLVIADKKFTEKLIQIIWNILNKKAYTELFRDQKNGDKDTLNSRTLNKNENIESYLVSLSNKSIKKAKKEILKSIEGKEDLFGNKTTAVNTNQGKITTNPKSTSRNTLIPSRPKKVSLKINQDKINNIFIELRDDLYLDKTINAIGVLFRVFLESTLDYFAEQEGMPFKRDTKLKGKITIVADRLETKYSIAKKRLKNIRTVATKNPSILSIQNFHDYVHEIKIIPKPADLILKWDELQEFFEIIYNEILIDHK